MHCRMTLYTKCSKRESSTSWLTHLQLGGDLLLQTTKTAWKQSYGSLQYWVTELSVRQLSPVPVSMMSWWRRLQTVHSYYRQHSTPAVSAPPPFCPQKPSPVYNVTYTVLAETLNPAQSINPPTEREHHYAQSLRQRSHNFQLSADRASVLRDKIFIMRML